MNEQTTKLPITFWIIGIAALIWNIMGLLSFFGQTFMSDETMATFPEDQQALYQAVPSWLTIVFGIAVFTGTLGCIALLMKKGWAIPLFLLSLITVLIQMVYNFFLSNAMSVMGTKFVIMSSLITLVALFLYYYAKQSKAKGWLS